MMAKGSLFDLVQWTRSPQAAVSFQDGLVFDQAHFQQKTACWAIAFSACPGSRIGLAMHDSYSFACALLGAWLAGKQVVVPGDMQPDTVRRLCAQVDICAGDLPSPIQAPEVGRWAFDAARWSAAALVVFTSGSSGDPISVHKNLPQLEAELQSLQTVFGAQFGSAQQVYSTVSHQHIYGLLFAVLLPLVVGVPFAVERLAYPEQMAACIGPQPSVLVSSPAHLKRLPVQLPWGKARQSLRAVFSSGGPLPQTAAQSALELLGHSPYEVFGSTETGGIAWRQRVLHGEVWQSLPGVQWRIEPGSGVIEVCALHMPDPISWYRTADRGQPSPPAPLVPGREQRMGAALQPCLAWPTEAGQEGHFILTGRTDRVVKIEEKRVSMAGLEAALESLEHTVQARVLVLPEPFGGGLGVVAVPSALGLDLLRHNKRALNEVLRRALLQSVERVALPRRFRYVSSLPLDSQGKTTQAQLARLFRPEMPTPQWRSLERNQAQTVLHIAPELMAFDGHFEAQPILPGVVLLHWAAMWGKSRFGLAPNFLRVDALKFQLPVLPGASLVLELQWHPVSHVLMFVYTSEQGKHASGQVVYGGVNG
jgi:acyl-CoA synthetase (AMP-forming)/AMP-acid ligase II/3-hydroxymyristoyl/3-hydroxydecanoyl-(acyl carrier protein) dehydratase